MTHGEVNVKIIMACFDLQYQRTRCFETSATVRQVTRRHIPERWYLPPTFLFYGFLNLNSCVLRLRVAGEIIQHCLFFVVFSKGNSVYCSLGRMTRRIGENAAFHRHTFQPPNDVRIRRR